MSAVQYLIIAPALLKAYITGPWYRNQTRAGLQYSGIVRLEESYLICRHGGHIALPDAYDESPPCIKKLPGREKQPPQAQHTNNGLGDY